MLTATGERTKWLSKERFEQCIQVVSFRKSGFAQTACHVSREPPLDPFFVARHERSPRKAIWDRGLQNPDGPAPSNLKRLLVRNAFEVRP